MKKFDIYLKPSLLRGWVIIRETGKCLVARKVLTKNTYYGKKGDLGSPTYVPKKNILRMEEVKKKKEGQEIVGVIGDFTWQETRDRLIYGLAQCSSEEDFVKIIERINKSIGTAKELDLTRRNLGIHAFTDKDLDRMEELDLLDRGDKK